jgi:hypothetical protein
MDPDTYKRLRKSIREIVGTTPGAEIIWSLDLLQLVCADAGASPLVALYVSAHPPVSMLLFSRIDDLFSPNV